MNNLENNTNIQEIVKDQKVDQAEINLIVNNFNSVDFQEETKKYSKEIFEGIKNFILENPKDINSKINSNLNITILHDYLSVMNHIYPKADINANKLKDKIMQQKFDQHINKFSGAQKDFSDKFLINKKLSEIPEPNRLVYSYQLAMVTPLSANERKNDLGIEKTKVRGVIETWKWGDVSDLLAKGTKIGSKELPFDVYSKYSKSFLSTRIDRAKAYNKYMFSGNPEDMSKLYNITVGDGSGTKGLLDKQDYMREAFDYGKSRIRQTHFLNLEDPNKVGSITIFPSGEDYNEQNNAGGGKITIRVTDPKSGNINYLVGEYKKVNGVSVFVMKENPKLPLAKVEHNGGAVTIKFDKSYSHYKIDLVARSGSYGNKTSFDEINYNIIGNNMNLIAAQAEPTSYNMSNDYETGSYKFNDRAQSDIKDISENILFDTYELGGSKKTEVYFSVGASDDGYEQNSINRQKEINDVLVPSIKNNFHVVMEKEINSSYQNFRKKNNITLNGLNSSESKLWKIERAKVESVFTEKFNSLTDQEAINQKIISSLSDKFKDESTEYRDIHISLIKARYFNMVNELTKNPDMVKGIVDGTINIIPNFTQNLDINIYTQIM